MTPWRSAVGVGICACLLAAGCAEPGSAARIRARLLERSDVPTAGGEDPYFRSLFACRYEVLEVLDGSLGPDEIVVMHWAVVRNTPTDAAQARVGGVRELTVEPWSRHRDLHVEPLSITLDDNAYALPWYCDTGGPAPLGNGGG